MKFTINNIIREIKEKKIDTIRDLRLLLEGEGKMSSYGFISEGDWFCSNCANNPLNKCYLFVYRCANCFTDFKEPIPSEIEIPKCPKCGYKSEREEANV